MKTKWLSLILIGLLTAKNSYAINLMQVYEQALVSDPIYQQAISQRLSNQEGVAISLSSLLPSANIQANPSVTKTLTSGQTLQPNTTSRGYQLGLSLSQTIFNFRQFANLRGAHDLSKQAEANLNAATQDLMLRVAKAYFAVLQDEDNLVFNEANKAAFAKQLDQINQQYQVGLKTITDVYTAQAAYDTAVANYIGAQTKIADDKENLRTITGVLYPTLAKLSGDFPLISPQPADMEAWVDTAKRQNWSIRAAVFASEAAREFIKEQSAGHLPSLNAEGGYTINYSRSSGSSVIAPAGTYKTKSSSVGLILNVPIFSGGLVVAETNQARYQYQTAMQKLEETMRNTASSTRQSYLGVIAGIQQIHANKEAIKSTISSLEGLEAGYSVGTQTLVDVLNQQQKVFQSQTNYASSRYLYVTSLLALKNAAGTLNQDDLQAINAWLTDENPKEALKLIHLPQKLTSTDTSKIKHIKQVQQKKNIYTTASSSKNQKITP